MPQIILGPSQTKKIDGSVKKAGFAFLEKLAEDDTRPGLNIEPIVGSADPRVRTGRVNDFYRAVLFKVQGQGEEAHYVFMGILAHDDAIDFAKRARLKVNPVNGIAELVMASEADVQAEQAGARPAVAPELAVAPEPTAEPETETDDRASVAPDGDRAPTPKSDTAQALESEADVDAAREAPSRPLLQQHGVSRQDLLDLGVDPSLAERALQVTGDDELIDLVENAVQWQALALIDLAGGKPVEEIRAGLGIEQVELSGDGESDAELLDALQHDAAKLQFAFIEDDEELRKAIEEDDFAEWRVFLHPEQRRYATRDYNGPFRLSGGAGTGKTVVLLHRARRLARQNPEARILLTTFSRVLADALKTDLRRLDARVPIATRLGEDRKSVV